MFGRWTSFALFCIACVPEYSVMFISRGYVGLPVYLRPCIHPGFVRLRRCLSYPRPPCPQKFQLDIVRLTLSNSVTPLPTANVDLDIV